MYYKMVSHTKNSWNFKKIIQNYMVSTNFYEFYIICIGFQIFLGILNGFNEICQKLLKDMEGKGKEEEEEKKKVEYNHACWFDQN